MQRYFVDKKEKDTFLLSNEDSYHLLKVMRSKLNDKVEIVCNKELYICEIISIDPTKVKVIKKVEEQENSFHVDIVQALVKEQKMDMIIQKATELGVNKIIPLVAERSVVKLNNKIDNKVTRWNTVAKNASEQAKRLTISSVSHPISIDELTKLDYDYKVLCSVNEMSKNVKKVLANVKTSDTIVFVVGPEGGFTKEEEGKLLSSGFISVTLGNNVLRTETASLFLLSIVGYHFMR